MDQFLETHKVSKFKLDELDNLHDPRFFKLDYNLQPLKN